MRRIKEPLLNKNYAVMENLIFVHRGQFISRRILGGILIVFAILSLIFEDQLTLLDWLRSIFFFLWGALCFTPLAGSHKSCIMYGDGNLKIKWIGWIREVTIPETEIEKITLASKYVLISRKSKKALRVAINTLKIEQRTKVYEFLIEYARQKNFALEK